MTTMATPAPRFDMGRVVQRTFGVIGRNWLAFGLLALLLAGLPQLILGVYQIEMTAASANGQLGDNLGQTLAGMGGGALLTLVGAFVLQAALIHGVVVDLNGRRATIGECIATGLRYFFPVLAISILMTLALMVGFLLLIVPGVLMALAWMVVVPAEVVERKGVFGSFSRSADLTRGHRGALFGLAVAFLILSLIIGMLIGAVAGGAAVTAQSVAAMSWPVMIATTIAQVIQSVIGAAGVGAIYYELRSVKEGIGPEALASVFD